jgi:uncharacterized protein YggE
MSFLKPISTIALVSTLALALASCSTGITAAGVAVPAAQNTAPKASTEVQMQTTSAPSGSGITVVGSGQVSAAPDIAQVTLGVETTGKEVKEAMDANATRMTALLSALKKAGVAEADIRTTNFSVYVENPSQPMNIEGTGNTPSNVYHVTNQVEVTVRDLTKLGTVLDEAVAAGANSIYGVNYSVSDPTKFEDEARTKAVADAKTRAQNLAQLEGVTLGSVVSVQEVTGYNGPVYAKDMAQGMGGGTPIQSGSLQISLSVQVTYAIQ